MRIFCEVFGHSFEQSWDAEPVRSSDGALMVHEWSCRWCEAITQSYEPMDAFIERMAELASRPGPSIVLPPEWMDPPRPAKFMERPSEVKGSKRWPQGMSLRRL